MVRFSLAALSLASVCFLARSDDANLPSQVHTALAGPTGMAISWQTTLGGATVAKWGVTSGALDQTAAGPNGTSYMTTFSHHAVITGLTPGRTIFYQVGDGTDFSPEGSVRAAPNDATSVRFALFGDLGVVEGDTSLAYLNSTVVPVGGDPTVDLIVHVGDAGYADDAFLGHPLTFHYEETFDEYMNEMQPMASRVPYMVGPGNHEGECHSPACIASPRKLMAKLGNFTAFRSRFRMPCAESGAGASNMWFSFDWGPVHFVMIDTETQAFSDGMCCVFTKCGGFMGPGGVGMMEWLEADLAEANKHRDVRPWVVVGGHRPMYQGGSVSSKKFQAAVEPLFKNYSVDIYFSGHVHSYERDFPVYDGVLQDGATTHIMVGGAGNAEMEGSQLSRALQAQQDAISTEEHAAALAKLWSVPPAPLGKAPWTAVTDARHFGIGIVEANLTSFHFDYIRTGTGEIFDSVEISK